MKITVYATANNVKSNDMRGRTAVVIDTLRATTTMITALANGAVDIAPTATIEGAIALRRSNSAIILGGERNMNKISEFDLGNSPLEYDRKAVSGRHVAMSTTNGTVALIAAVPANVVLAAALINVGAAAKKIVELKSDCAVLCAGTDGRFSVDDIVTAGAIISRIRDMGAEFELDDLGLICERLYDDYRNDMCRLMEGSRHYNRLAAAGYDEDLQYCLKEDIVDFAPEFEDGILRK